MKKISIVLSAAFVLFALASCNKEIDNIKDNAPIVEQPGSIPFVLQANLPQTKTTLDPSNYEVSWADGDIIYAVTTDGEWGSGETSSAATAASFTYSGSASSFSTEGTLSDGSHTFYFVYEPSSQVQYHRSAATTFSLQATQSQNCSDATAHIKQNDVLAGKLTATTPAKLAKVDLAHVNVLMQFNITNNTGADATITGFDITFDGANIAGTETISFASDPATASITTSGKEKITVSLTNGDVANGDSLPIYFVMAPLADYTGDVTINVYNSAGGYYTHTSTISSAISFVAGSYNRSTVPISSWINPLTFTRINDVDDLTDGDYKYVIVGQRAAGSFGFLTYGTPDGFGRLNYVKAYDALPATTLNYAHTNSIWSIAVSTTEPKTATLYNAANDKYLKANSALSFGAAGDASSFTVTSEGNLFAFAKGSTYLGVSKSADYWRDYASSTLFYSSGKVLALYRYWEESSLSSIALSGTHPTVFHQGDAFSYEGLIVRASYANGKERIVTPTSVTTPDMSSVADDVEVTVSYTEGLVTKTATYTVDITSAATPKTITKAATTHGSFVTDPDGTALPGATVTVTATPEAGYALASISVVGDDTTPVTVTGNTFVMPDQNVTVSVVFGQLAVLSKTTFTTAGVSLTTSVTTEDATTTIDGISVTYKGVSTNQKNTPTAPGASGDTQKVKTGQLILFKKSGGGYIYNTSSLTLKKIILELVGTNTTSSSANTPTVSAKTSTDSGYTNVALPSPVASSRNLEAASGSTPITVNTFMYEIDMTGKNFFKVVTGSSQLNVYSISVIY